MAYVLLTILIIRIMITVLPSALKWVQRLYTRVRLKSGNQTDSNIFSGTYIDVKAFYLRAFRKVPSVTFVGNVNTTKVFEHISEGHAGKVLDIYQYNYFNWQQHRQEFLKTVFILENKVMIDLGDEAVVILFHINNLEYADNLVDVFKDLKASEKDVDNEINIITLTSNGLDLKKLEIEPTELDIDLYYNDDFRSVDNLIKERLAKGNDKGIVLLHGLPGTGKTTYLRHLIGKIKKKVLFVSPSVAGNLMNPEFIDLLIDNPNAVLVIEDAENIIMDRKYSNNSGVSNLLNISDGLLSDCLNVQIICTFNSALSLVDSALLRKGRLIAKYEFGKLEIAKAERLSKHLGLQQVITKPMTLAEVTNPDEKDYLVPQVSVIGFRRMEELMEN